MLILTSFTDYVKIISYLFFIFYIATPFCPVFSFSGLFTGLLYFFLIAAGLFYFFKYRTEKNIDLRSQQYRIHTEIKPCHGNYRRGK